MIGLIDPVIFYKSIVYWDATSVIFGNPDTGIRFTAVERQEGIISRITIWVYSWICFSNFLNSKNIIGGGTDSDNRFFSWLNDWIFCCCPKELGVIRVARFGIIKIDIFEICDFFTWWGVLCAGINEVPARFKWWLLQIEGRIFPRRIQAVKDFFNFRPGLHLVLIPIGIKREVLEEFFPCHYELIGFGPKPFTH